MAKRSRDEIRNPALPGSPSAPKYQRIVPKHETETSMSFRDQPAIVTTESSGMIITQPNTNSGPHPFTNYGHHNLAPFEASSNFPTQSQPQPNVTTFPQPVSSPPTVKFETALEFLDQVKIQFAATPGVYEQFLKIMKDFKQHEIDTPGVITRVSNLFQGHDHLILGFNRFLPEGYKITLNDVRRNEALNELSRPILNPVSPTNQMVFSKQLHPLPNAHNESSNTNIVLPTATPVNVEESPQLNLIGSPSGPEQQPELDHARNYVKKIKMRFEKQPDIYKNFLRILHTFHEEHHTIKDVYDQVAQLFSSHQDLLAEFKQFLPDKTNAVEVEPSRGSRRLKSTRRKGTESYSPRPTTVSANDYDFFDSARSQLRNEPHLFADLLKVMQLFNDDILTAMDLLILTRDLFSEYPELFDELRQFCDFPGVSSLPEVRTAHDDPAPIAVIDSRLQIDYSTCLKNGPSYRCLPDEFIRPVCSGRTELCNEVLNDDWVSVSSGSEDFKTNKINEYEESLFYCEDERFELDMVIEKNLSAIRSFAPIITTLKMATVDDLDHFRLQEGLNILHIRDIELIYGARSRQVLQALCDNPAVAVPVVLRRLKQKDKEWRIVRSKWNDIWQETYEKNFYRALDHRSDLFKQQDKKNLNPRELLSEIKQDMFICQSGDQQNLSPSQLTFCMNQTSVFGDILKLITLQAKRMANNESEVEKFSSSLIAKFFIFESSDRRSTNGLFFGNNSFFVFFRFYQLLYDRLLEAKRLAQLAFEFPPTDNYMIKKIMAKSATPRPTFGSADELYHYFLKMMLHPLVIGTIDSATYEDLCRELLGITSFTLFTMHHLLKALLKQILSIFLEETSSKLLHLHSYEETRTNGTSHASLQSIYHANALDITREERCFKFIYLPESDGLFSIQILDPAESQPAMIELTEKNNVKEDNKAVGEPEYPEPGDHNVFLGRNRRKMVKANLDQAIARSGLECKICTSSYRLFYVEETEDFFYRPGKLTKAKNMRMDKQTKKLHDWADNLIC